MKLLKKGRVVLLLGLCVLASCNRSEEFFPTESKIAGADAFCSTATDEPACLDTPGCQPAYSETGIFEICIADPDYYPDETGGGTDGSTVGGTDGGTDGSTVGGTVGGTDGSTDGGTSGGSSTGGSSTGASSGGSSSGGSTGGDDGNDDDGEDTIEDVFKRKCKDVDPKYLWIKTTTNGNNKTVEKKVKICHQTGNNSNHTIIIACQALKPHISHHGDYLGACHP